MPTTDVPLLFRRLRRWLPKEVSELLHVLEQRGGRPVLVGGALRDAALGRRPNDWDVAVDMQPRAISQAFGRVASFGEKHGTVLVLFPERAIEVTSFRASADSWEARLLGDLQRRDYTVNAMAFEMARGRLTDPFHGLRDLQSRLLRGVDDPLQRLHEDPLRLLRAVRLMAQLDFHLENKTAKAICALPHLLLSVAGERLRQELYKLLSGAAVARSLAFFQRSGLLLHMAPELCTTASKPWNFLQSLPQDPWLRLAAWLWLCGGSDAQCWALARRLQFSKTARLELVTTLQAVRQLQTTSPQGAALRHWAAGVGLPAAQRAWRLARRRWPQSYARTRTPAQRLRHTCLSVGQLHIGGAQLLEAGVAPRNIGATLQVLLDAVLTTPQRNRYGYLRALVHKLSTGVLRP